MSRRGCGSAGYGTRLHSRMGGIRRVTAIAAVATAVSSVADAAPARSESPDRGAASSESPLRTADPSDCAEAKCGDPRNSPEAVGDDPGPEPVPIVVSVFPGAILHGAGHWAAGQKSTGYRLLAIEGIGLAMVVIGGGTLALTGANRYLVAPAAVVTIAGVGLFALSWLGDIYGVSADRAGSGSPLRTAPVVETELGYRYIYDPQFAYRSFAFERVTWRRGPYRVAPEGWFALDDKNVRLRLEAAYRFSGPAPGRKSSDGSFVDVEVAGTHHTFGRDGFRVLTAEASAVGRLDLKRFDPALRGAFVDASVGCARQFFDLDVPGEDLGDDQSGVLLGGFGFGMYFGHSTHPRGEASIYYDHRHDDFAAGLKLGGTGSGPAGHFGISGELFFLEDWGVRLFGEAGSALIAGVSVAFRHGGSP